MAQEATSADLLERLGRLEDDVRSLRTNPRLAQINITNGNLLLWEDTFDVDHLTSDYNHVSSILAGGGLARANGHAAVATVMKNGSTFNTFQILHVTSPFTGSGFITLNARARPQAAGEMDGSVQVAWIFNNTNGTLDISDSDTGTQYAVTTPLLDLKGAGGQYWVLMCAIGRNIYGAVSHVNPVVSKLTAGAIIAAISVTLPDTHPANYYVDGNVGFRVYSPTGAIAWEINDYYIWGA